MKLTDLPKHHAILIEHKDRGTYGASIFKELQSLSLAHRFFNQTVLDIETARIIVAWALTPYNDEKIALISFHTIGHEAQNVLLKVLEEPRDGVRFILITSNKANLLDTLLSRVLFIQDKENKQNIALAETFLATTSSLRMKLGEITTLLAKEDEEERKDRESIRNFILSLSTVLKAHHVKPKYIQETLELASYAADPSASGKALIEYLTLLLPQIEV